MIEARIVIVGLGLMGGSLARALRPYCERMVAVDTNAATCQQACVDGVVDEAFASLDGLELSLDDLLILATPVQTILHTLKQLPKLAPYGCMVMDLGSTKMQIIHAMGALPGWFQSIGGHPMCGREVSGYAAGSAEMYRNQTFVLTPTVRTTPHLMELAKQVVTAAQANLLILPPEAHDEAVATVSHVPYVLSATLMHLASVMADDEPKIWQVSASGFRDTSRISGSSPHMMRDILLTNREAVLRKLRRYQDELSMVIDLLESADSDAIEQWLHQKQAQHQQYVTAKTGVEPPNKEQPK